MTMGEIIRHKQPDVYFKLMIIIEISKNEVHKIEINRREAERLMRHDSYVRGRGGIRQTRRG